VIDMGKWTDDDIETLRRVYPTGTKAEIMAALPSKSWDAILCKASRLGISKVKSDDSTPVPIDEALLGILSTTKATIAKDVLKERLEELTESSISDWQLNATIEQLRIRGYDIGEVVNGPIIYYFLSRYANPSSKMFYRRTADMSGPIIMTGDWHYGSKGFSGQALEQMRDCAEEYGVKHICVCGDLLQGRGVHRLEGADVLIWDAQEQVRQLANILNEWDLDLTFEVITGNHEWKLKSNFSVGYDAVMDLASRVKNMRYYGSEAHLTYEGEYTYTMLHTDGGITYAPGYRPRRVYSEMVDRPNILHTGHTHQLFTYSPPPSNEIVISGTLQRENAWLKNKGITTVVGWILMEEYDAEHVRFTKFKPRVF